MDRLQLSPLTPIVFQLAAALEQYQADFETLLKNRFDSERCRAVIRELAEMVRELVYPQANVVWDDSKPDGTPRKLLNVDRIHALGWRHRIELAEGIKMTYAWFCEQARGLGARG